MEGEWPREILRPKSLGSFCWLERGLAASHLTMGEWSSPSSLSEWDGVCDTYLDIEEILSEDWRTIVNGRTLSIELATEHLCADRHAEDVTSELAMSVRVINICGSFEDLLTNKSLVL